MRGWFCHVEISFLNLVIGPETRQLSSGVENQTDWNQTFCQDILHDQDPQLLQEEYQIAWLEDGKKIVQDDIVTVD